MTTFARLSPREKLLVAVLCLLVVPLGLWFLVAQPLQDNRARAIGELAAARADYQWVVTEDAKFRATSGAVPASPTNPLGLAAFEAALANDALDDQVTTLEETTGGRIRLNLQGTAFDDLGRFIEQVTDDFGYQIVEMQILPGSLAGEVDARLGFMPR